MESFDMTMLGNIIENQGFSVLSSIALFYMLYKEMTGNHKIIEKFTKAIDNNTKMIERIELLLKERNYLNEETTDSD